MRPALGSIESCNRQKNMNKFKLFRSLSQTKMQSKKTCPQPNKTFPFPSITTLILSLGKEGDMLKEKYNLNVDTFLQWIFMWIFFFTEKELSTARGRDWWKRRKQTRRLDLILESSIWMVHKWMAVVCSWQLPSSPKHHSLPIKK